MNPRDIKKYPITWTGNRSQPIFVGDFRDIDLTIVGTGTATVLGSADKALSNDAPDFTIASTISNSYATMVIADLTTPSTYATSLIVANATKIGEVNTNLLMWVCITRSANTLDAFITVCDNA